MAVAGAFAFASVRIASQTLCGITKLSYSRYARRVGTLFVTSKLVFVSRNFCESENSCGQEARRQHLITSVWLFRATLFNFGFESHGEAGLCESQVFLSQEFAKFLY